MPASEQTWRSVGKLHIIFGISCVVLFLSTVWMFLSDHQRPWKEVQRTTRHVDLWYNHARRVEFETTQQALIRDQLEEQLEYEQQQELDTELVNEFIYELTVFKLSKQIPLQEADRNRIRDYFQKTEEEKQAAVDADKQALADDPENNRAKLVPALRDHELKHYAAIRAELTRYPAAVEKIVEPRRGFKVEIMRQLGVELTQYVEDIKAFLAQDKRKKPEERFPAFQGKENLKAVAQKIMALQPPAEPAAPAEGEEAPAPPEHPEFEAMVKHLPGLIAALSNSEELASYVEEKETTQPAAAAGNETETDGNEAGDDAATSTDVIQLVYGELFPDRRGLYHRIKLAANNDADIAHLLRKDWVPERTDAVKKAGQDCLSAFAAFQAEASESRNAILTAFAAAVKDAEFKEKTLLGTRKFKNADRDAKVAELGLEVRDNKDSATQEETQAEIDEIVSNVQSLTLDYQKASTHASRLKRILRDLTANEAAAQKELDKSQERLVALQNQEIERRATYFVGSFPYLGKKWLELPILDAFNSPLRPANLWSDGLEIDYNFRPVRRFDRCTTCHQNIDKTFPGSAVEPGFLHSRSVDLVITAPTEMPEEQTLVDILGFRLAEYGALQDTDVSVSFVWPSSPGAKATLVTPAAYTADEAGLVEGEEIINKFRYPQDEHHAGLGPHWMPSKAGLRIGDVITRISGDPVISPKQAEEKLLGLVKRGAKEISIQVRRGLPNPYVSHPRLDLFVGSLSPHSMDKFACTICHEGQGSATEFKWASHTPDSEEQRKVWDRDLGWFDNHHWIYPMYPKRFAESACLKCHHDVVELSASKRFPEAPAPKVIEGHELIKKYGCFGCHEVNGYDSGKRIGPDMRAEPNFFAAAQQLSAQPDFNKLSDSAQDWALELIHHPENKSARHRLLEELTQDAKSENPTMSAYVRNKLTPLFKDIESPGTYRKSGPALRFVGSKSDHAFLYDWINNPQHFRPSTKMPRFFGLWKHLTDEEDLQKAKDYEPVEIQGIVTYLLKKSQDFKYIERPEWSVPKTDQERDKMVKHGKTMFQTRGCLACHSHDAFPDAKKMNKPGYVMQGPDLSNIADKLDPTRNPNGAKWLYSWVKKPNQYHVRTVMPDLFLGETSTKDRDRVDVAADIVEYLMAESRSSWTPAEGTLTSVEGVEPAHLDSLTSELLKGPFFEELAERYAERGIPAREAADLKGAEIELVVPDADFDAGKKLSLEQKLVYVGSKTINKYGCFGCHDIPGFEDAKPIGTGLAEWGRKDPSKLAFEHIAEYLHHSHGHGGHGDHGEAHADAKDNHAGDAGDSGDAGHDGDAHGHEAHDDELPPFYHHALHSGHRSGFIYQKLLEPRSYDYHKTHNKSYGDRLRMPQFPFGHDEREAVITFVLGLVADPPSDKYIYQPDPKAKAIIEGKKLLNKYNCAGCHILEGEKWEVSFEAGQFKSPGESKDYPFLASHFTPAEISSSATPDKRGLLKAILTGMPGRDKSGAAQILDQDGVVVEDGEIYLPSKPEKNVNDDLYIDSLMFDLWGSTLLNGEVNESGTKLPVRPKMLEKRSRSKGGYLAKYLLPHAVKLVGDRDSGMKGKGTEAWGWLPPPLIGEGDKVQSDWLHDFLLEPYTIRPATLLRMPKFNMTSAEATAFANYFAAIDDAQVPFAFNSSRQKTRLEELDAAYREATGGKDSRMQAAMRIVTNKCVTCHYVGDFNATNPMQARGPNLADVYRRLRPDYLRRWVANPKRILPYTGMPVNIPYADNAVVEDTQYLYHGTTTEQLDGLVDLLMNYDQYAANSISVNKLVEEAKAAEEAKKAKEAEAAAAEAEAGGDEGGADTPDTVDGDTNAEEKSGDDAPGSQEANESTDGGTDAPAPDTENSDASTSTEGDS